MRSLPRAAAARLQSPRASAAMHFTSPHAVPACAPFAGLSARAGPLDLTAVLPVCHLTAQGLGYGWSCYAASGGVWGWGSGCAACCRGSEQHSCRRGHRKSASPGSIGNWRRDACEMHSMRSVRWLTVPSFRCIGLGLRDASGHAGTCSRPWGCSPPRSRLATPPFPFPKLLLHMGWPASLGTFRCRRRSFQTCFWGHTRAP